MYARQVLKNFNKIIDPSLLVKENALNLIDQAQKFHIGNNKILLDSFDKYKDTNDILKGQLGKAIRLPYKICWFELYLHDNESIKQCFLVEEITINKKLSQNPYGLRISSFMYDPVVSNNWLVLSTIGELYENPNSDIGIDFKHIPTSALDERELESWITTDASTVCKILLLLNCKNIVHEKVIPNRKMKKRNNKVPFYSYHVLKVQLNTKRNENKSSSPLDSNRIHLCRGHFKVYTKEKPLFGKYTGMYWWQPMIRGNKEKGIVEKDYLIENKSKDKKNTNK